MASLTSQSAFYCFWGSINDFQKGARGTVWETATLLPISQASKIEAKAKGELGLGQTKFAPNRSDIYIVRNADLASFCAIVRSLCMLKGLLHSPNYLMHFSFSFASLSDHPRLTSGTALKRSSGVLNTGLNKLGS